MGDRVETLRLVIDGKEVLNNQTDLQLALKQSKKELTKLEEGTVEWINKSQDINKISKRLDDVKTKNKETANEWKKQTVDYKKGIKDRIDNTSLFGVSVGSVTKGFKGLSSTLTSGSKVTKLFNSALAASPLFILVGVLTVIVGYFTKTQKGMDLLAKASTIFSSILNLLIQRVIQFGTSVFKIFTGLGKLITDRKEGLKLLKDGFSGVKESVTSLGDSITKTFNKASELADLKVSNRALSRETSLLVSQLEASSEALEKIADDATRSFEQREKFAKLARLQSEKASQSQIALSKSLQAEINKEVEIAKISGEVSDELKKRKVDAQIAVIEAQKAEQSIFLDNEKRKRELIQDRIERDIDISKDGFEAIQAINFAKLKDDKLTAEQRDAIFEETEKLRDLSFQKQIESVQKFTSKQIDANSLIKESNATVLNEKIRELGLSEIIEGRLLEVVKDRQIALQDFADLEKELNTKRSEEVLAALENQYAIELNALKTQRLDQLITEQEYSDQLQELELTRLVSIKQLKEQIGLETLDIEGQIIDKEIELLNKKLAAEKQAQEKRTAAEEKANKEQLKADKALEQTRKAKAKALQQETAAAIENAETIEDAAKGVFNVIRKEIKAALSAAIASVIKNAFATSPPLVAGVISGVGIGTVNALFNKFVPSFSTGGPTGSGNKGLGRNAGGYIQGVVEEDEFVVSAPYMKDPHIAQFTDYIQQRMNGNTQATPPTINNNVTATVGMPESQDLKTAAMTILEAANVLSNTNLTADISLPNIRDIRDIGEKDNQEKENTRKRGAL